MLAIHLPSDFQKAMNGYAVSDARVETSPDTTRGTATLLFLFVGSGCSALIYEVVWFHLLRTYAGRG